ncbi:MAG: hypothetical protein ACKOWF_15140 [Chloroflexota bacterium]
MDRESFDRIARGLAGATSRRDGLRALIGGLAGLGLGAGAAAGDVRHAGAAPKRGGNPGKDSGSKRPAAKGRPAIEGPCGNGKRKDNICTSDGDCCTGICNLGLRNKNKDKRGRCRCMKRNKPCTSDINCCNVLTCNQGRCSFSKPSPTPPKPAGKVPTGSGCSPVDTCASAQAECTIYTSNEPRGSYCLLPQGASCSAAKQCAGQVCSGGVCGKGLIPTGEACAGGDTCASSDATCVAYGSSDPAGTYCLLANGGACDQSADCVGQICADGVCASVPETCDVCPTCTYTTIQEAIDDVAAGSTIRIDEGDYVEDLTVEKNLTLKACNGAAVTVTNATAGRRVISRSNNETLVSLTITGLVIEGNGEDVGGGIFGWYNLTLNGSTQVRASRVGGENVGGCIELGSGNFQIDWDNDIYEDGTTGACSLTISGKAQVTDCLAGWHGGAIWMGCIGGTLTMNGEAAVTSGASGEDGGSIWTAKDVTITLADKAFVGGSYCADDGGGIFAGEGSKLRMSGSATVLGNRSGDDGGGIATDSYTELDMSGQSVLADNTSDWSGGGFIGGCYNSFMKMSDQAEVRGNSARIAGGGAYLQGSNEDGDGPRPLMLSMRGSSKIHANSTRQGSDDGPYAGGGGAHVSDNARVELDDQASIFDNTTERWGAGLWSSSDVTLKGTASIRNNTARSGAGGVFMSGPDPDWQEPAIKLKVASTAKVTGNKPDQCQSSGEASC